MSISVLLVDDSQLARIVLKRAVRALQPEWVCLEAHSAEDAIVVLDTIKADVVLLDFNMPGVNGLTLAAALRQRHPRIPIALVTAVVQDALRAEADAMRVSFVSKPVTEDSLRAFLGQAAQALEMEE